MRMIPRAPTGQHTRYIRGRGHSIRERDSLKTPPALGGAGKYAGAGGETDPGIEWKVCMRIDAKPASACSQMTACAVSYMARTRSKARIHSPSGTLRFMDVSHNERNRYNY